MQKILNIISSENNAKILKCSSYLNSHYNPNNILNQDRNTKWISANYLPQEIIFDLSSIEYRPYQIKSFGIQCVHAKTSNPKRIEIQINEADNYSSFISIGTFDFFLKKDIQLYTFQDSPLNFEDVQYIKIIIHETFGDSKTYLNQFYIFEEIQIEESYLINTISNNNTILKTNSTIDNHLFTVNSNSNTKQNNKYNIRVNTVETRITTIENEIIKISNKLDTFINRINNITPYQSYNNQTMKKNKSKAKLKAIHEKKLNITMNYLDNKIKQFKLNLNINKNNESYDDIEVKTERFLNLATKYQNTLSSQTQKELSKIHNKL